MIQQQSPRPAPEHGNPSIEKSRSAERQPDSGAVNVGPVERGLSALAGGAIALHGLNRGGLRGAFMTLVGPRPRKPISKKASISSNRSR
jgi:uncharacterized membrane protein